MLHEKGCAGFSGGIMHLSLHIIFFVKIGRRTGTGNNRSASAYCFLCVFPFHLVSIFTSCYIFLLLVSEEMSYSHLGCISVGIPDQRT